MVRQDSEIDEILYSIVATKGSRKRRVVGDLFGVRFGDGNTILGYVHALDVPIGEGASGTLIGLFASIDTPLSDLDTDSVTELCGPRCDFAITNNLGWSRGAFHHIGIDESIAGQFSPPILINAFGALFDIEGEPASETIDCPQIRRSMSAYQRILVLAHDFIHKV